MTQVNAVLPARDAGEDTKADEILEAIRDNVRRYHQAGIAGTKLVFSVDCQSGRGRLNS